MKKLLLTILNALKSKPSPKVEAVIHTIAELVIDAAPIVAAIAALVPNRTVAEVATAYVRYGVPAAEVFDNSVSIGNALLNLGTALLTAKNPGVPRNVAQSAVQLAVSIHKA